MANDKKFVVKNGLTTQNISFVDDIDTATDTITVTMLDSDTLSFSGDAGQLFSITDTLTGTIFAVNDISGIPSIEVDDDGTIRFAEFTGNILIGTATDDGTNKLQLNGDASATNLKLAGAIEIGHATDTTLSRTSAGVLAVEGVELTQNTKAQTLTNKTINTASNTLTVVEADISDLQSYYVPGGTDVPITDGGTGSSTAAGAATNLGLGTGDSPQFAGVDIGGVANLTQDGTDLTLSSTGEIILDGLTGLTIDGNNVTNQPVIRVTNMGSGNSGLELIKGSGNIKIGRSMDWASPLAFLTTNKGLRYVVSGVGDATLASHHFSHDANSSSNQLAVMGVRNADSNSLTFQAEQSDGTVIFSVDYNGAIEIGHATDTTLARVSAGLASIEGDTIALLTATQTMSGKTITDLIHDGSITEQVYAWTETTGAVTGELEPAEGTVQTVTLTGNITSLTDNVAAGESITLGIDDGTAYTITWPTITWVNNAGAAPTLATSGYTWVAIWKVSTTLYGALVGDGT